MSRTVAYIDSAVDDEILEVGTADALPLPGQHVDFDGGDAKGHWLVTGVRPVPHRGGINAYVTMQRQDGGRNSIR